MCCCLSSFDNQSGLRGGRSDFGFGLSLGFLLFFGLQLIPGLSQGLGKVFLNCKQKSILEFLSNGSALLFSKVLEVSFLASISLGKVSQICDFSINMEEFL